LFYEWNWSEAKKNFDKVFAINPNYFPAYYWYSFYLAWVEGKFDEAIQVGLKGIELEPLLPTSYNIVWAAYLGKGEYEDALRTVQMAIELGSNSILLDYLLGMSLTVLGKYEEAIKSLRSAIVLFERHPWLVSELCWAYSLAGEVQEAQLLMDELVERSQKEYISGIYLFIAAYSSKNFDKAFEYMELASEQRASLLVASRVWPTLEPMRTDPRFQAIIQRMHFPG
jgi:tetratricopeptide (TPR) repeat protein